MRKRPSLFLASLLLFSVAVFLSSARSVQAIVFTRPVFVQNVTTTSIELRWKTDTSGAVTVRYGTTTAYGLQVASDGVNNGSNNHARITGLSPNTRYFYQLVSGTTNLTPAGDQSYTFKTAPTSCTTSDPCTYAIMGDSGEASTPQKDIALQIDAKDPDVFMIAGDVVYDYSSNPEYNDARFFDIYANLSHGGTTVDIMRRAPVYATCGNHDSGLCSTLIGDQSLPQNNGNASGIISTFSWDYGDIHFVAINSNASRTATSPQIQWMVNDLRASNKPWKVVMWHHNWWSAGSHSTDSSMEAAYKAAHDAGADAIFWGHSHVYERWNRLSTHPNVQAFTIGNGGNTGSSSCTNTSPGPGCNQKSSSTSGGTGGFLYATVAGNSMTIQYVTQTGNTSSYPPVTLTTSGVTNPPSVTNTVTPTRTPTVTNNPSNSPTTTNVPTLPPVSNAIRIDSGSTSTFSDSDGNLWSADNGFTGGTTVNRGSIEINNTENDVIYQTERYNVSSYDLNLPAGSYDIRLHFAETSASITGSGQRVFDMDVEGREILDIDVMREAGGKNNALVKTLDNVDVSDGQLNIVFTPNVQSTMINGIEIIPQSSGSNGDGNGDGRVDGIDFVIWMSNYGRTIGGASNGDYNNDGRVDGIDYVVWFSNYGGGSPSTFVNILSPLNGQTVPSSFQVHFDTNWY